MYSFPVTETETILRKAMANLYYDGDALLGALYLTDERIVFVGHSADGLHKYMVDVLLAQIEAVRPGRSLFIVPNVLHIHSLGGERYKMIVGQRDSWQRSIQQACQDGH